MSYLNFGIIFPLLKRSWHGIDYSYLYFIKRSEIHGYDKADLVTSLSKCILLKILFFLQLEVKNHLNRKLLIELGLCERVRLYPPISLCRLLTETGLKTTASIVDRVVGLFVKKYILIKWNRVVKESTECEVSQYSF